MHCSRYFRVDWILIDQLAIGPAPKADRHVDRLHRGHQMHSQPLL